MQDSIKEKVIVITGASSGIGEATARHLATRGARVVLGARRSDRLQTIVSEIRAAGGQALAVTADVTNAAEVQALVDAALQEYGRVDVMINNAGLMAVGSIHKVRLDEWQRMVDVNIRGVLHGIAAALLRAASLCGPID